MPYKSKSDLPESVRTVLPPHAQEIYMEAFNVPGISTNNLKSAAATAREKRQPIGLPGRL